MNLFKPKIKYKNKCILMVIGCSKFGGAQKMFLTIAKNFSNRDIEIIFAMPEGPLTNIFQNEGFHPIIVNYKSFNGFHTIIKLLNTRRIDIIHSHLTNCSFYFSIINIFYNKRIICSLHNPIIHEGLTKFNKILYPFFYFIIGILSDGIILNSNKIKQDYNKTAKISMNKLKLIKNGIDIDDYKVFTNQVKKNKMIIGFVGRLSIEKGVIILLEAVKLLNNFDWELIIVGDGPLRNDLEKFVKNNKLDSKVNFVGFKYDVKSFMVNFDIFVLPSLNEVMPISILEAFIMKKLVIASDVGGIPDLIENGVNGYLFENKNFKMLKSIIEYVHQNKIINSNIIDAAYKDVINLYNSNKMCDDIYNYIHI